MADQDIKLHLVTGPAQSAGGLVRRTTRPELSLGREPNVLGLFLLAPQAMRIFAKAIEATRPRFVFDLRVLPVFEGGGITRKHVFRTMDASRSTYVDAMGLMGGRNGRTGLLHSGAFAECIRSSCGPELIGPMFFLLQSGQELAWACSVLPKLLQPTPDRAWSVKVLGAGSSEGDQLSFIDADAELTVDTVQPWSLGEVLYVVASRSESTGWLLDEQGRPGEPVNLKRGCSVRVAALQIGQWTDVEVLAGPYQRQRVRLASNTFVARLVK